MTALSNPNQLKKRGRPKKSTSLNQKLNGLEEKFLQSDLNWMSSEEDNLSENKSPSPSLPHISGAENSSRVGRKDKYIKLQEELEKLVLSPIGYFSLYSYTTQNEVAIKDAKILTESVPNLIGHMIDLARTNEKFFKILENMTKVTTVGLIVSDIAAIILGLAANHGKLPNSLVPFFSPTI